MNLAVHHHSPDMLNRLKQQNHLLTEVNFMPYLVHNLKRTGLSETKRQTDKRNSFDAKLYRYDNTSGLDNRQTDSESSKYDTQTDYENRTNQQITYKKEEQTETIYQTTKMSTQLGSDQVEQPNECRQQSWNDYVKKDPINEFSKTNLHKNEFKIDHMHENDHKSASSAEKLKENVDYVKNYPLLTYQISNPNHVTSGLSKEEYETNRKPVYCNNLEGENFPILLQNNKFEEKLVSSYQCNTNSAANGNDSRLPNDEKPGEKVNACYYNQQTSYNNNQSFLITAKDESEKIYAETKKEFANVNRCTQNEFHILNKSARISETVPLSPNQDKVNNKLPVQSNNFGIYCISDTKGNQQTDKCNGELQEYESKEVQENCQPQNYTNESYKSSAFSAYKQVARIQPAIQNASHINKQNSDSSEIVQESSGLLSETDLMNLRKKRHSLHYKGCYLLNQNRDESTFAWNQIKNETYPNALVQKRYSYNGNEVYKEPVTHGNIIETIKNTSDQIYKEKVFLNEINYSNCNVQGHISSDAKTVAEKVLENEHYFSENIGQKQNALNEILTNVDDLNKDDSEICTYINSSDDRYDYNSYATKLPVQFNDIKTSEIKRSTNLIKEADKTQNGVHSRFKEELANVINSKYQQIYREEQENVYGSSGIKPFCADSHVTKDYEISSSSIKPATNLTVSDNDESKIKDCENLVPKYSLLSSLKGIKNKLKIGRAHV